MLPKFEHANVGPIYEYKLTIDKRKPNSFYANKFCLFTQDEALQRALWRAETSRRAVQAKAWQVTVARVAKELGFSNSLDEAILANLERQGYKYE